MNAPLSRGLGLAALHVAVQFVLGLAVQYWTPQTSSARLIALVLVAGMAIAWGAVDGRRDRLAHGEQSEVDFPILWLQAGVIGGLAAGASTWLIDKLPGLDLSGNSLLFELTAAAAWILLLIYVPATIGVGLGRLLANRATARVS
ncbi:B-4DMT family transporter [Nocardia sp. NBC_00565]|uniref:B-4DMT family transporter n=1 Tax=Nocardia sp. NBC_00565 TaxID=2975993 RepID=UPI002E814989|nr:B-4DMT family transporter [Nocardia sp. NBC_00565]WUC05649.1 B-4DMT family transporter [Nocardia sp. NBC_00565]